MVWRSLYQCCSCSNDWSNCISFLWFIFWSLLSTTRYTALWFYQTYPHLNKAGLKITLLHVWDCWKNNNKKTKTKTKQQLCSTSGGYRNNVEDPSKLIILFLRQVQIAMVWPWECFDQTGEYHWQRVIPICRVPDCQFAQCKFAEYHLK